MTMTDLMDGLSPDEQDAVRWLQTWLSVYGGRDGTGLFSGTARYAVLTQRLALCAERARDLQDLWCRLNASIGAPVAPRKHDQAIFAAWRCDDPQTVLTIMTSRAQAVVMIARELRAQAFSAIKGYAAPQEVSDMDALADDLPDDILRVADDIADAIQQQDIFSSAGGQA